MIDARHLQFARAFLYHCAKNGRIRWGEYNDLMRDIVRRERLMQGCAGKEAFATYELAQRVADRPCRDGQVHRKVFHCAACGLWHLASIHPQARKVTLRYKARKAGLAYA